MESLTPQNILTFGSATLLLIYALQWCVRFLVETIKERIAEHKATIEKLQAQVEAEREHNQKKDAALHNMHIRTVEVLPEITTAVDNNTRELERVTGVIRKCEGASGES